MKKYLVIGNPVDHSLSPKLHNYWIKENNLNAIYEKKNINEADIAGIIDDIKIGKIDGINVTVPFKKLVIPFLDQLTPDAKKAQSVNIIFKKENKVVGGNTDIEGFELGINHTGFELKNKKILILGAGGVVSSIILALKNKNVGKITISNRTKEKAEEFKKNYTDLEIVDWGNNCEFDVIINATSLGLKKSDEIELKNIELGPDKFLYDIIYNPNKTNFLLKGEARGSQIENGRMMFIYQAQLSFNIWHKVLPKVDDKIIKLLE